MLQSQVNYWTLQENVRSHKESEAIQWYQNYETNRHNMATELISERGFEETRRHNLVSEDLGFQNLSLEQSKLSETHRANRVREKQTQTSLRQENKKIQESRRHNKAAEAISKIGNEIGWFNAYTNRQNALSNAIQAQASSQNAATNRFAAEETQRHNTRNEYIDSFRNANDLRKTLETGRHNLATETQASNELGWNKSQYLDYQFKFDITDRILKGMDIGARAAGSALGFVGKLPA